MRRLVLNEALRCPQCRLPRRWCICAARRPIELPLQVDVLMHVRERQRPSSTGNLIHRLISGSQLHLWRAEQPSMTGPIEKTRPECWILHPHGDQMPVDVAPAHVQVLLLDGSWSESSAMNRAVGSTGRLISLPMSGESRYWLRDQQDGGRFSTVEALMFVLASFGLGAERESLRRQFELHVYANLRARGQKARAEEFLKESPVPVEFAEFLAQLNTRRPRI